MKNIALFASGNGTNVEQISTYLIGNPYVRVSCLIVNKPNCYAIQRAKKLNIDTFYFNREDFYHSDKVLNLLIEKKIDFVFLAGFLWLVPQNILNAFDMRIINIHPALLPNYGGKGMYGENVHKAVIANKEAQSGITIHYVDQNYDQGKNIFQAYCTIKPEDTVEDLEEKIHLLEKKYYPLVVEAIVLNKPLPQLKD